MENRPTANIPFFRHGDNAQQLHPILFGAASQSPPRIRAVTSDRRTDGDFAGRFFGLDKHTDFHPHDATPSDNNTEHSQRFITPHEIASPRGNEKYENSEQDDDTVTMDSDDVEEPPTRDNNDDKIVPDVSRPEIAWRVRKYNAIQFLYSRFESSAIFALSNEQIRDVINAAPAKWGEQNFPVHSVSWLQQALLERKRRPSKRSTPKPTPPLVRHSPAPAHRIAHSPASSSSTKRSTTGLTGDIRAAFKKRKRVITRPQLSGPSIPSVPAPAKAMIVDELESLENMMSKAHVASPSPNPSPSQTADITMHDD